jgi:hypothetical protein
MGEGRGGAWRGQARGASAGAIAKGARMYSMASVLVGTENWGGGGGGGVGGEREGARREDTHDTHDAPEHQPSTH